MSNPGVGGSSTDSIGESLERDDELDQSPPYNEVRPLGGSECQEGETRDDGDCGACECRSGEWLCEECNVHACIDERHPSCNDPCLCIGEEGSDFQCLAILWTGPCCEDGQLKGADDECNACECLGGRWHCTDRGECASSDCSSGITLEAGGSCN